MLRTLKGIRNDLGLTQKEMADKVGIPYISYQRYENSINRIPASVLVRIADLADITDVREIKYQ